MATLYDFIINNNVQGLSLSECCGEVIICIIIQYMYLLEAENVIELNWLVVH